MQQSGELAGKERCLAGSSQGQQQGISDGSSVSLKPLMCLHHYSGGQRINLKNLLLIMGRTGSLIVAQSFPIIPSKFEQHVL